MLKNILALSLAGLLCGTDAALAADEAKPNSCAFVRTIDSWTSIDEDHAYLYTSPRHKFKVKFFAPCRELKWAIFARLETRPSSAVCLSVGDTLIFGRGALMPSRRFEFEERCTITEIEPQPLDQPKSEKPAAPATP